MVPKAIKEFIVPCFDKLIFGMVGTLAVFNGFSVDS